jgi:hypothetical protein
MCAHAPQNRTVTHPTALGSIVWVELSFSAHFVGSIATVTTQHQPTTRFAAAAPACRHLLPSHTRPLPFFGVLSRMPVGAPSRAPPNRRPMHRPPSPLGRSWTSFRFFFGARLPARCIVNCPCRGDAQGVRALLLSIVGRDHLWCAANRHPLYTQPSRSERNRDNKLIE